MVNYRIELAGLSSGFENLCSDCANPRCTHPIEVYEKTQKRLFRNCDSTKEIRKRTEDDYLLVSDCDGYQQRKLGVKNSRFSKFPNVVAIVRIEPDQTNLEEKIVLYGNNDEKLGIIDSEVDKEIQEGFKRKRGKIVDFISEEPSFDKSEGLIFIPHLSEKSTLDKIIDALPV